MTETGIVATVAVAEPIVPFATRVMVILSPVFAYKYSKFCFCNYDKLELMQHSCRTIVLVQGLESYLQFLPTNLDTSSLGEQNITYSAPPDAACNVPDSINRTVTVQAKPLGLETLTIGSNNKQNNLYAKTGDKITITLVANGTIGSATATVASIPVSVILSEDANDLTVFYDLPSSIADTDSLEFSITVTNEDDTATSIITEANLPGSSIIIDNTAPTITLAGNNNIIVFTNSSYNDPGATASDSSYASDITVNGVNNFDINKSGNYTFTYTAPDDKRGNANWRSISYDNISGYDRTWITCLIIWCSISKRIVARFINIKIIYSIYCYITCI